MLFALPQNRPTYFSVIVIPTDIALAYENQTRSLCYILDRESSRNKALALMFEHINPNIQETFLEECVWSRQFYVSNKPYKMHSRLSFSVNAERNQKTQ